MKIIVFLRADGDPGATANDITLKADALFLGTGVPGVVLSDSGPNAAGIPIPINITQLNLYNAAVVDAMILRASQLALPVPARTDVLLPTYQRGV